MSSLQLSIAFSKHQVTAYSVTHACPVGRGRMKMAPWLKILSTGAEVGRSSEIFKTDPSRPRPRPRPQVSRCSLDLPPVSRPRPRPGKIGLECSPDQDRGLEDYISGKKRSEIPGSAVGRNLGPPNNFSMKRAIRFKFGTDIEDGASLA